MELNYFLKVFKNLKMLKN